MERGAVASLRVPAVDVVGREEPLQPGQVALLGGVEQSGVSEQQVGHLLVGLLHQVQRRVAVAVLLTGIRAVLRPAGHTRGQATGQTTGQVRHVVSARQTPEEHERNLSLHSFIVTMNCVKTMKFIN